MLRKRGKLGRGGGEQGGCQPTEHCAGGKAAWGETEKLANMKKTISRLLESWVQISRDVVAMRCGAGKDCVS